jgi:hypothetical protein
MFPLIVTLIAVSAPALAVEQIPVSGFRSVQLRGGGEVIVRPGPVQRVTITEGSSRHTRIDLVRDRQLRIDMCNNQCPEGYRLRVEIQSPSAPDVAIAGGGSIRAHGGFAPQRALSVAVHGGGLVDVRAVPASNVSAAVHGGGQVYVGPRDQLSAAVHGGGQVRYAGNPQVSMAVHGGGLVRPVD